MMIWPSPFAEQGRDRPLWGVSEWDRDLVSSRAEHLLRERQSELRPFRPSVIAAEEIRPIEIRGERLKRRGHVAEPERTPRPVSQQMQRDQAQMVFRPEDADPRVSELQAAGARVELLRRSIVQLGEAHMQIHRAGGELGIAHKSEGLRRVFNRDVDIDIAKRPEVRLRIGLRGSPSFPQDRFEAGGGEAREGARELLLLVARAKCARASGLMEAKAPSGDSLAHRAEPSPDETGCAGVQKEGPDLLEVLKSKVPQGG